MTKDRAVVYITSDEKTGPVSTWGGAPLGTYEVVSEWRNRAPVSGERYRMRAVRVKLDAFPGVTFHGHYGCDWSQMVRVRRMKTQSRDQDQEDLNAKADAETREYQREQ